MFMFNNLLVDKKLSLEFMWCMTINIIGVEFENRDCALIWTRVMAPNRSEKARYFKFKQMDFIDIGTGTLVKYRLSY